MNPVERNLTVFTAHCQRNRHEFEVYDFPDFYYGERLIRSLNGQSVALLPLNDEVATEVKAILAEIYGTRMKEMDLANRFDHVFGLSCDPVVGNNLDATAGFICPDCNSCLVSYLDASPPRFKSFHIPVITHEKWLAMMPEQRRSLIEEELRAKRLL